MLVSRDTVEIDTPPERIFEWFCHLDDNYRSWHPDHVSCRHVRGHDLQDGAVLYAEEYLHGRLHRLKFRLTEVEAGREFRYRIFPGVSGGFRTRPTEKGTEFVAEIFLGWSVPVFGGLVDAILKVLFSNHVGAIRQHMREEGINLRALLSAGTASVERAAEYGD
jgi:hypothetical protein